MKKIVYILLALFILLTVSGCSKQKVIIIMHDGEFNPSRITIQKGSAVEFKNVGKNPHWPASNIHPTHEIYPAFDPKRAIPPGENWSFTFKEEGIWRFHDHIFPEMKGVITVE